MPFSPVQQASAIGDASGSNNPAVPLSATTAGNLLVAIVMAGSTETFGSHPSSFSLPAGWAAAHTITAGNQSITSWAAVQIFYYENNPGGITSVTVTPAGSDAASKVEVVIYEFPGVQAAASLDQTGANQQNSIGGGTQTVSTAATTTAGGDLGVFGMCVGLSNATQDYGTDANYACTEGHGAGNGIIWITGYRTQTSPAVLSANCHANASTGVYVSQIATFLAGGGAPDPFPAGYGFPAHSQLQQLLGGR